MSEPKHYESIITKKEGGVGWLTLNRPHRLNTLTSDMIDEMHSALDDFEADKEIKCIVITGAGDRAFSAGADVTAFTGLTPATAVQASAKGQALFTRLEELSKPVIASLNGYALGGGLEMALACDFRLVSETAELGQPEVKLGLIPGWGGTQRLSRIVGLAKAKELIMLGERISAEEVAKIGLVSKVVPKEKLVEEVGEGAVEFRNAGPVGCGIEDGGGSFRDRALNQRRYGRRFGFHVQEET